MSNVTALKKASPLSKAAPPSRVHRDTAFDKDRLVQELLSLDSQRIDPKLAIEIASEVEVELLRRPAPQITAGLISKLVEFKLQELGLLPPVEEPTPRTQNLLQKSQNPDLSTLERFLIPKKRNSKLQPAPPHAVLRAAKEGLQEWSETTSKPAESFEKTLKQIAERAAKAEQMFANGQTNETIAVEFFNTMANQEFYPHEASLLGTSRVWAHGGHQIWIPLPMGPNYQNQALREAKTIWEQGGLVGFIFDNDVNTSHWTPEAFDHFLQAVERSILELPDTVAPPKQVELHLLADHPHATQFAELALSGKYYPNFTFCLVPHSEELDAALLEQLIRGGTTQIFFPENIQGKNELELPRWSGGPLLAPYEACQLGSLNLAIVAAGHDIDWVKLRRIVRTAIHFLDNLITVSRYPLERIAQASQTSRKVGLGVMGFAELLLKLNYAYDSDASLTLAGKVMRFIHHEAEQYSQKLARSRGDQTKPSVAGANINNAEQRHATILAISPAPILAKIAGVTAGIQALESLFAPAENQQLKILSLVKSTALRKKAWTPKLEEQIQEQGSIRKLSSAPASLQRLIATRDEIEWDWSQKIQAAFEKQCEGTVDLEIPQEAFNSIQELSELLQKIKSLGAKQIRIQQNGLLPSLTTESLAISSGVSGKITPAEQDSEVAAVTALAEALAQSAETRDSLSEAAKPLSIEPRERPEILEAKSLQINTPSGKLTATIASDDLGPYEMTTRIGKGGSTESIQTEALSRMISLLLSSGVEPKLIYEELKGFRNGDSVIDDGQEVHSIADAIAILLDRALGLQSQLGEEDHFQDKPEEDITEVVEASTIH